MIQCSVKMLLLSVFASVLWLGNSFYLPGMAPTQYCTATERKQAQLSEKDCPNKISLYVNALDSEESVLPYEYRKFDFCQYSGALSSPTENLGQVVFGERIRPSPYNLTFNTVVRCQEVCSKSYTKDNEKKLNFLQRGALLDYHHHW
jgi:transmembrane 9 superfamily protein 2/4